MNGYKAHTEPLKHPLKVVPFVFLSPFPIMQVMEREKEMRNPQKVKMRRQKKKHQKIRK